MRVEQSFFIGVQDVGAESELTNKAILEALTNTANLHGRKAGQGHDSENQLNIAWFVLNWKLSVFGKRPKSCETFTACTWARSYSRACADRDFELFDKNGTLFAKATSRWSAVDIARGSLIRLTPEIMEGYQCEPGKQNFPGFRFENADYSAIEIISEMKFRINKAMIDRNNHVHNTAYLDIAQEILPEGADRTLFNDVEILYKKAIPAGSTVLLQYAKEEGKHYVLIKSEDGRTLHSAIVMS